MAVLDGRQLFMKVLLLRKLVTLIFKQILCVDMKDKQNFVYAFVA